MSEQAMIPNDPDALLNRTATSQALVESGFPVTVATLATAAVRGYGPPYKKFGRAALYKWDDALNWARARMSAPRRATSDQNIAAASRDKSGISHAA
jgi:hypothetical protein